MSKALTVFLKELKDSFRDKRTIISSILIPALIVPVMFLFMGNSISGVQNSVKTEGFKIAFEGNHSYLEDFLSKYPSVKIVNDSNPEKLLNDGKLQAIIKIPDDFNTNLDKGNSSNIEIKMDQSNSKTNFNMSIITEAINSFSKNITINKLKAKNIDPSILNPVNVKISNITKNNGESALLMSFLLPFFIMMWPAVGAMISASDLGAGEKERGTLEPLLSTQAGRTSIAVGKWLAVAVSSLTGAVALIIGFMVSVKINPTIFSGSFSIKPTAFLVMILVGVLISFMYSAVMLALSVFARNVKEAGTYMSPVEILAMLPAYLTMYNDIKTTPSWQFAIPLYNVVLVLKEALLNSLKVSHLLLTVFWSLILIVLALYLVIRMYNSEKVVFRS